MSGKQRIRKAIIDSFMNPVLTFFRFLERLKVYMRKAPQCRGLSTLEWPLLNHRQITTGRAHKTLTPTLCQGEGLIKQRSEVCVTGYREVISSSGIASGSFSTFSQPELSARIWATRSSRSLLSRSLRRQG